MKLCDEQHQKEFLKHITASIRSHDEIIAFLDGNTNIQHTELIIREVRILLIY